MAAVPAWLHDVVKYRRDSGGPHVGRPASVGGGAMVAQLTLDQKVVGSSPTRPARVKGPRSVAPKRGSLLQNYYGVPETSGVGVSRAAARAPIAWSR